jgi:hypothetical protein
MTLEEMAVNTKTGDVIEGEIGVGNGLRHLKRTQNGWTSLLRSKQHPLVHKRTSNAGKRG